MPDHKTKFNETWLDKSDENGNSVKTWLKKGSSETTFICILCRTGDLDCANKGWKAIEQHMHKEKHKKNLNAVKNNSKFIFPVSTATTNSTSANTIQLANQNKSLAFDDQITKAEILWALKSVQHGFSYKSSDNTGKLFQTMFPDSKIAEKFSIQHAKMSYVISHGLGPYFRNQLVEDLKNCQRFVLCFDEQTNNQNKKQLDLLVRYWRHAQATVVAGGILESFATDGIDIKKILMLSRDNPNVNKAVEKLINDAMKKVDGELLNIGPCNLHVVYNGFKAGTTETSWHVENFCMDIWSWFRKSPARHEDFENIVDELNDSIETSMLYFTCTRWILLGKVIERILKQFDIFREYFLVYLPSKQRKIIQNNSRYDSIKLVLTSSISKVRFNFILFLCRSIFDRCLTWFQKEGPLIHLLYFELCDLYRTVLLSFLSSEYVGSITGGALLDIDFKLSEKQLPTKKLQIGEEARRLLTEVSAADRATFFDDVKMMYHAIADNLKKHLPLKNTFLKDLHVLDPAPRTQPDSIDKMIRVGRAMSKLLTDIEIDRIRNEYMMYAAENIDECWYIKNKYQDPDGNNQIEYYRVDYYWNKVLSLTANVGLPKYPTLAKIIKNVLIISHGNSDVERGFSINEHLVTEYRTLLSLASINGLRSVWDTIKFLGSDLPHLVPINIDMIRTVQKSKSVYNQEQLSMKAVADRMRKETEANGIIGDEMKKLTDQENDLLSKQKTLQTEQKKAQLLVGEGRQRLDNALKKADMLDAQAANALIGAGDEQVKLISEELIKVTDELIKIQSKRKNTFSHGQSIENKKQKITTASSNRF
ncbi:unnamed protein product [Adineta steineri]|uniref:Uncharacterized protein n=1 Tax=Adineta steineri TaxID=433720 RepID=A0A813WQV4_9BILA|nr:unnamed protein product [Adineta steineri]CAF3720410.1 unnamed protein product [Adineta steineri]